MKKNLLILSLLVSVFMVSAVSATYGPVGPDYAELSHDISGTFDDVTSEVYEQDSVIIITDDEEELQARWDHDIPQGAAIQNVIVTLLVKETTPEIDVNVQLFSSDQGSSNNDPTSLTDYQSIESDWEVLQFSDQRLINEVQARVDADEAIEIEADFEDESTHSQGGNNTRAKVDYIKIEVIYDAEAPVIVIDRKPVYPTCSSDIEVCATVTDESAIDFVNIECTAGNTKTTKLDVSGIDSEYCAIFSANSMSPANGMEFICTVEAEDVYGNNAVQEEPNPLATYDCEDPIAIITGNLTCNEGTTLTLSGANSYDINDVTPSDELTYSWIGVDSSTGDSATINCVDDALIDVTLTVTDNAGHESAPTTHTVEVLNIDPKAMISGETTGDEGSDVTLTGSETDVGVLDTHTFKWIVDSVETTGDSLSVHCIDEESYLVTLEVTDDDLGVGTKTHTVQCENVDPTIDAGTDQTVNQGQEVTITPTVDDVGVNDVLTVEYDFGNGFSLENTFTYCVVDTHTVTVRVTDGDGGEATDTLTVTVNNVLPTITLTGEPYIGIVNEELIFTATGFDVCDDSLTIEWDFGAGYSTDNTNSWSERFPGTVSLRITDENSGEVTADVQVDIYDYKIDLEPMCNLISVPLVPTSTAVLDVLDGATPNSVWAYKYNPATEQNEWYYHPGASAPTGVGNLDEMIPGYGYYVCTEESDTIYANGEKFYEIEIAGNQGIPMPPQVELTTGWNLIGHYGMNCIRKSLETQDLSGGILTDLADVTLLGGDTDPDKRLQPTVGYWAFITGQDNLWYAPSEKDYSNHDWCGPC